jgi:PAB1-binding protein PBP1
VVFCEIVIVLEVIPAMVVEAGMPVPEMGCPSSSPVTLDTPVMVELPVTTMPVGVAFAAAVIAVTTEPCGIPMPGLCRGEYTEYIGAARRGYDLE